MPYTDVAGKKSNRHRFEYPNHYNKQGTNRFRRRPYVDASLMKTTGRVLYLLNEDVEGIKKRTRWHQLLSYGGETEVRRSILTYCVGWYSTNDVGRLLHLKPERFFFFIPVTCVRTLYKRLDFCITILYTNCTGLRKCLLPSGLPILFFFFTLGDFCIDLLRFAVTFHNLNLQRHG